jgi:hypothetical protein
MFKYLSGILLLVCLVLGGFYLWEKKSHLKTKIELENELTQLQGIVQETKTAYSRQALELQNLKVNNSELQKIIKDKDETIFAISQVALKLKDKAFEDKNVNVTVLDPDGNPVSLPATCEECLKNVRLKVEFNQGDDLIGVSGYTLTNPGYAFAKVVWKRPLQMNLVLTRTKTEKFKVYLDAGSDAIPSELDLKFDPSVFEKKWYEKISVVGGVGIGKGLLSSLGLGYEFIDKIVVGPSFHLYYDGIEARKLYGANVTWFPFR